MNDPHYEKLKSSEIGQEATRRLNRLAKFTGKTASRADFLTECCEVLEQEIGRIKAERAKRLPVLKALAGRVSAVEAKPLGHRSY